MRIVERREYEGAWWGRTRDGTWFRWNAVIVGWEGPLTPPWPKSARHPEEEAIVAAAMAVAMPPDGRSMNRVDRWWNRHFPPFSTRRLMFGLAALPVIGALQELLWVSLGRDPSLPRYLFVCVAGGALLATAWLPGMRDVAERLAKFRASRSPWPRRRKPGAEPLPPIEMNFRRDFLVALPFTFVIVAIVNLTVAGPDGTFKGRSLTVQAVAATATAAMVALRSSIWSLVLFSVVAGVLGGLGVVFLSLMTFSDTGWTEFAAGWVMGSVVVFAYAHPLWRGLRDMEARGIRFPMWLVMGGSVLLVSGAALVFVAER